MRIHHLNCISSCPLGGRLMDRRSNGLRGKLASRVVLVETASQLVLTHLDFDHAGASMISRAPGAGPSLASS